MGILNKKSDKTITISELAFELLQSLTLTYNYYVVNGHKSNDNGGIRALENVTDLINTSISKIMSVYDGSGYLSLYLKGADVDVNLIGQTKNVKILPEVAEFVEGHYQVLKDLANQRGQDYEYERTLLGLVYTWFRGSVLNIYEENDRLTILGVFETKNLHLGDKLQYTFTAMESGEEHMLIQRTIIFNCNKQASRSRSDKDEK